MSEGIDFKHCQGWIGKVVPEGVKCPPEIRYPRAPDPVKTLFVSWNPPGLEHFWNNSTDKLRRNLRWVLQQEPFCWKEPDFIAEFWKRGCYLVHAARCWQHSDWPDIDVVETCARALLGADLKRLQPKTLCLLGEMALWGARTVIPALPIHEPGLYRDGWSGERNGMKVIITALPLHDNKEYTLKALRRWWLC
jgi:hypothetical protein